ncbi:MAG: hypothetical protein PHN88_07440 [Ignavibacteria bacterium]|nr:hypothetical protein [Ignavibacteria bacterium]
MGEDYSDLQKKYQEQIQDQLNRQNQQKQENRENNQNNQNLNKLYRKSSSGNSGCIVILLAAGLFIAIGIAVIMFLSPDIIKTLSNKGNEFIGEKTQESAKKDSKNSLEGAITNVIIIPRENSKDILWLTSYEFKGSKYLHHTYIYDPYSEKIIFDDSKIFDAYPPTPKLFLIDNELWSIVSESGTPGPGVYIYNPLTGNELSNTDAFIDKYPELKSGISRIYAYDVPPRLDIETRDGRKFFFDITSKKMYAGYSEYKNTLSNSKISIFALGIENSSENARKRLFLVTGPESSLSERNVEENYFSNLSTVKFITKSDAKVLIEDKIFLEGVLLFQDDESCFIFYQNQTGANAERYLSCINKEGTIVWTASTEKDLFAKLKASDKESSSGMFFIKSSVHVSRSGNLVLLYHDRDGFMGFDYNTGKVLFKEEVK